MTDRPGTATGVGDNAAAARLDRLGHFGFFLRMRQLARQVLRIVVVALALSASGLNGYAAVLAAFDAHAHGHGHGAAAHEVAHPGHGADPGPGLHADQPIEDQDPASGDLPCKHVHMHCCSSVALAAADIGFTFLADAPTVLPVAAAHLPPGELAAPLFRPPRAAA